MRRGNKGIFGIASSASLLLGLLAMTSALICESWATFDIFDQPVQRKRKEQLIQREDEMRFLSYPQESFLKGNYEEAFASCQKLADYSPAQKVKGEILYLMGLSCLKLNRFLEARSYFNDVILIKDKKEYLKRDAHLGIAEAYFLEERFDKAVDAYNQILTKYPDTPAITVVYYRLAEALSKMGRLDETKYYLDKVRHDFPFSFEAQLSEKGSHRDDYYSVQVGCFNEKDNADKFCEKLVEEGFDAYILGSEKGEEPKYRVKVGRFHSRGEAEVLEVKLKRAGYSTRIYP